MTTMPAPALTGPDATAGRRRFWQTVLVFFLLNIGAWIVYDRVAGPRRLGGLLRVEQFLPGDGAIVDGRAALSWRFNLDVALDVAGAAAAPPAGTISPPLAGQWHWDDPRTITFTPARDLPRATRFTCVLLREHLRTAQGISMARPFVCQVATEAPRVVQLRQRSFDQHERYVLEIEFNDAVSPAQVLRKTHLSAADGQELKFEPHGAAEGKIVRLLTDPLPASRRGGGTGAGGV